VGGLWITSRDAAGRFLPGILIAFVFAFALAFVIGSLPDYWFWFSSFAGRI
jgi:hypothetical protein